MNKYLNVPKEKAILISLRRWKYIWKHLLVGPILSLFWKFWVRSIWHMGLPWRVRWTGDGIEVKRELTRDADQWVLATVGELLPPLGRKGNGRGCCYRTACSTTEDHNHWQNSFPHPLVFCQYPPSLNLSQSRGWGRPEDSIHRLRLSDIRAW